MYTVVGLVIGGMSGKGSLTGSQRNLVEHLDTRARLQSKTFTVRAILEQNSGMIGQTQFIFSCDVPNDKHGIYRTVGPPFLYTGFSSVMRRKLMECYLWPG